MIQGLEKSRRKSDALKKPVKSWKYSGANHFPPVGSFTGFSLQSLPLSAAKDFRCNPGY
jgi:hypothetical protein